MGKRKTTPNQEQQPGPTQTSNDPARDDSQQTAAEEPTVEAGQFESDEAEEQRGGAALSDRFRTRYRKLTDDELAHSDDIKELATELDRLFHDIPIARREQLSVPDPDRDRYIALARTRLEEAVMWAVKAVTL